MSERDCIWVAFWTRDIGTEHEWGRAFTTRAKCDEYVDNCRKNHGIAITLRVATQGLVPTRAKRKKKGAAK